MTVTLKNFKKVFNPEEAYNKPNAFGVEGEDHLNISRQSNLTIGRFLDPCYLGNFEYPGVGVFVSTLALGYWLRSKDMDDRIRKLRRKKLSLYATEHKLNNVRIINYMAIIGEATWLRLKSRPELIEELLSLSELPILSYHTHKASTIRISTNYAYMITSIVGEITSALKEDREPDFNKFANRPVGDGNFITDFVKHKLAKLNK